MIKRFQISSYSIKMREIKHLKVNKDMKVFELVKSMESVGHGARKIALASKIVKEMFNDEKCKVFFGVAGAMVPGGMKEVIIDILDEVDVFVTTGATLTHDLGEALDEKHFQGDENANDEELNKLNIDRMNNVYMKNSVYEKLEVFFEKNYDKIKNCKNIKEFLWKIGELSPKECILKKCWEKRIPVFCPGIADSGIGLMMWGREVKSLGEADIKVFSDIKEIIDIAWKAKKTGVIYVGGGLPKNFIQQALQFSKGADYGIQITTDRPEPGGSSGASLKEGISWGKMKKNGNFVDVFCDATIALPLILSYVKE